MAMIQSPSKTLVIICSVLFVSAVSVLSQNNEAQEENTVYLAILTSFEHAVDLDNAKYLSSPAACQNHPTEHATAPNPLFTAFAQANSADATPIRLPALKNHFTVIDWAETRRLNSSKDQLSKIFSTMAGVVMLSRVGFDASHRQAVVCIESRTRGLFYALHKEADTWVVDATLDEWIK